MVFASLTFLYIFLPLNLILYYISRNEVYRNLILTLFSIVFYAWGEPLWVFLLIATATLDYGNALFIKRFKGSHIAKLGLLSSIILNIGVLMTFKYSGFIVSNVNALFNTSFHVPAFSLPVGISFYTFQALSYVFDVYWGKVEAQKSYLKFLMFISLYHQLVAGPIVRYETIAHEIDHRKHWLKDITAGFSRFCIGLFKKVCIANVAAALVLKYMGDPKDPFSGHNPHFFDTLTVGGAWFGIAMYTFQIYFDFSGYSDMAIGLGRMFGFHYLENFNYPYIAKSAGDFWRRWHISLSTWFRDYIYIPLGGNKKRWIFNLLFVWFVTGMWHGASWNYILWGMMWGLLILMERLFLGKVLKAIPDLIPVNRIYLLFFVMMGWTLFYFTDFNMLGTYFRLLFNQGAHKLSDLRLQLDLQENMFWIMLTVILCLPVYKWADKWIKRIVVRRRLDYLLPMTTVFNLGLLFLATCMLAGKSYNPFIYYHF